MGSERIHALNLLSIRALGDMWSRDQMLFLNKSVLDSEGVLRALPAINTRYTAMSLIGLHKAWENGYEFNIPTADIAETYLQRLEGMSTDELALAFWLNALYQKRPLAPLLEKLDRAMDYLTGRESHSMVLAWLLMGLVRSYAVEADTVLAERARRVKEALLGFHCPGSGLFRNAPRFRLRKNLLRSAKEYRSASFAAQIYPTYSLAAYHRVFGDDGALAAALGCARRLVHLQGTQGQWWWIYHPDRGTVVEKYPVYAVHQDGMAPMGLFEVQEASGESFEAAIDLGLDWTYGRNELGRSLVDEDLSIVWRALQRKEPGGQRGFGMGAAGHSNMALGSLLGGANFQWLHDRLYGYEILTESRSYHLGWVLTAYADKR